MKLAAGAVCAGGCLGILIPPSVMLILYGATAGVSVVKLYAGAFLPGHDAGVPLHDLCHHDPGGAQSVKLAPKLPAEERERARIGAVASGAA